MRLRIVTVASDYYGAPNERLIMDSQVNNEAIVVLSNETPYFDELEQAMKIRKYVKQRNVSQLPESIQDIIRKRQQQARILEERARSYIEKLSSVQRSLSTAKSWTSRLATRKTSWTPR